MKKLENKSVFITGGLSGIGMVCVSGYEEKIKEAAESCPVEIIKYTEK
jgi:ferredoxin